MPSCLSNFAFPGRFEKIGIQLKVSPPPPPPKKKKTKESEYEFGCQKQVLLVEENSPVKRSEKNATQD